MKELVNAHNYCHPEDNCRVEFSRGKQPNLMGHEFGTRTSGDDMGEPIEPPPRSKHGR